MDRAAQFKEYLQDVRSELKKVVWPTRKDTATTTLVVFGMVILVSLFLWAVDSLLAFTVRTIIG